MPAVPITVPGTSVVSSATIVRQNRLLIPSTPQGDGPPDDTQMPVFAGLPGKWDGGIGTFDETLGFVDGTAGTLESPSFNLPTISFYIFASPYYPVPNSFPPVVYTPQASLAFAPVTQDFGSIPICSPIMIPIGIPVFYTVRMPLTRIGLRIFNFEEIPAPNNTYTALRYIISCSQ